MFNRVILILWNYSLSLLNICTRGQLYWFANWVCCSKVIMTISNLQIRLQTVGYIDRIVVNLNAASIKYWVADIEMRLYWIADGQLQISNWIFCIKGFDLHQFASKALLCIKAFFVIKNFTSIWQSISIKINQFQQNQFHM